MVDSCSARANASRAQDGNAGEVWPSHGDGWGRRSGGSASGEVKSDNDHDDSDGDYEGDCSGVTVGEDRRRGRCGASVCDVGGGDDGVLDAAGARDVEADSSGEEGAVMAMCKTAGAVVVAAHESGWWWELSWGWWRARKS